MDIIKEYRYIKFKQYPYANPPQSPVNPENGEPWNIKSNDILIREDRIESFAEIDENYSYVNLIADNAQDKYIIVSESITDIKNKKKIIVTE